MRKRLLAFGLAVSVGLGTTSLANALAATAPASTLSTSSPSSVSSPVNAQPSFSTASFDLSSGVSGAAIVQYAMRFLGYPYSATGDSPGTGFSCIGFVSYVYRSLGINLPGDLGGAMAFAPSVAFSDLLPGDVLYFQNTVWPGLSHAAIYIGGGRFIHAEWYNRGVVISSFTNDPVDGNYWTDHYLGANRPWTGAAASAAAAPATLQPTQATNPAPTAPPARAVRHGPSGPTASVHVPSLNVRAGPSIHATIVTAVAGGTGLVILHHRQGWYKVALPSGAVGWVIGAGIGKGVASRQGLSRARNHPTVRRYVTNRKRAGRRSLPAQANRLRQRTPHLLAGRINRQSKAQRQPTRHAASARAVIGRSVRDEPRAKAALNVRARPSLAGSIIAVLEQGGSYRVLRWSYGWAHVRLMNGTVGWISGTVLGSRPSISRTPRRQLTGVRRMTSSGGTIARAALNVRHTPSLGAAIVSIVPAGGSFRILGRSGGWARVRLAGGGAGWISGSVLGNTAAGASRTRRDSSTSSRSTSVHSGPVAAATVRVHASPDLTSPAIGLAPAGKRIQVLGSDTGWAKVRLASRQVGYILGTYVKYG